MSLAAEINAAGKRIVAPHAARILTLDIETSPNVGLVWGLWNQNISLSQLMESGRVICFAAKWYGTAKVEFFSDHHDGHAEMVAAAHRLLGEADMVVTYNGDRFDLPHLNAEFYSANLPPHSPVRSIDLYKTVKGKFAFPSKKLDYVAQRKSLGAKVQNGGMPLWVACLYGDDDAKGKAWTLMRRYNIQDVRLTEKLYDDLRPWIHNHPHIGLFSGEERSCPQCGSTNLTAKGWTTTHVTRYAQYQCDDCGGWSRANHRKGLVTLRGVR